MVQRLEGFWPPTPSAPDKRINLFTQLLKSGLSYSFFRQVAKLLAFDITSFPRCSTVDSLTWFTTACCSLAQWRPPGNWFEIQIKSSTPSSQQILLQQGKKKYWNCSWAPDLRGTHQGCAKVSKCSHYPMVYAEFSSKGFAAHHAAHHALKGISTCWLISTYPPNVTRWWSSGRNRESIRGSVHLTLAILFS